MQGRAGIDDKNHDATDEEGHAHAGLDGFGMESVGEDDAESEHVNGQMKRDEVFAEKRSLVSQRKRAIDQTEYGGQNESVESQIGPRAGGRSDAGLEEQGRLDGDPKRRGAQEQKRHDEKRHGGTGRLRSRGGVGFGVHGCVVG